MKSTDVQIAECSQVQFEGLDYVSVMRMGEFVDCQPDERIRILHGEHVIFDGYITCVEILSEQNIDAISDEVLAERKARAGE
jgi:hypothetical protein